MTATSPNPIDLGSSQGSSLAGSSMTNQSRAFSPGASSINTVRASVVYEEPKQTVGSLGKPSPFPHRQIVDDGSRSRNAGIGGPSKAHESMSGIGNNLRNNTHAGLGRSVAKGPGLLQKPGSPIDDAQQKPSGLSKLLRRNSRQSSVSSSANIPLQRRMSTSSAANQKNDTTVLAAGSTVTSTNSAYVPGSAAPMRRGSLSVRVQNRQPQRTNSIGSPRSPLNVGSMSASQANPVAMCAVNNSMSNNGTLSRPKNADASPLTLRMVRSGSSDVQGSPITNSFQGQSPTTPRMTIGSPTSGSIMDVVGSSSNPTVVYAPVERSSGIGGSMNGKSHMVQKQSGIGGVSGKDWMADRPSGLGSSVPRGSLPKSGGGLHRAMRTLSISRKKKNTDAQGASATSPTGANAQVSSP